MNLLCVVMLLANILIPTHCYEPQKATGEHVVYPTQKLFLDSEKPLTIYFGGMGSGKTESLLAKAIKESLMIPNNSGIIAAESYPVLRKGAMYKFFMQLERLGIDRYFKYNKSDKIGFFSNGSRVIFAHCQNPESLKGSDEGWIAIDELTSIRKKAYTILLSRARLHNKAKVFSASNTDNPSHWAFKDFIQEHEKDYLSKGHILTKDMLILRAPTTENINLPESYINRMNSLDESDVLRFVRAEWTTTEGLIYGSCYNTNRNELNSIALNQFRLRLAVQVKHWTYMISLDPSSHNFAVGHYLVNIEEELVYKIHEDMYREMETSEVASKILADIGKIENYYGVPFSGQGFIDSAANQTRIDIINYFRKQGKHLDLKLPNKVVLDGIMTVKSFFNTGKFKIADTCKYTINDRSAYRYKYDDKMDLYLDEPDKNHYDPHHLDESRYLIHSLFGYRYRGGNTEIYVVEREERKWAY